MQEAYGIVVRYSTIRYQLMQVFERVAQSRRKKELNANHKIILSLLWIDTVQKVRITRVICFYFSELAQPSGSF